MLISKARPGHGVVLDYRDPRSRGGEFIRRFQGFSQIAEKET
jgi:hypothetical protein